MRTLRPLGYGGLLDQTFELYRENFLLFAGITGVVYVPLALLQVALVPQSFTGFPLPPGPEDMPTPPPELGGVLLYGFIAMLLGIFVPGVVTKAIADRYLNQPASIGASYGYIFRRFFPYLWTWIVVVFVVSVIVIGFSLLLGLLSAAVPLAAPLLIALAGILIVWVMLRCSLVGQVFVVEQLAGMRAVNRSWQLAGGYAFRIFVAFVLLYILILVLSVALSMGLGTVAAISQASPMRFLVGFMQGVLQMLLAPIPLILLTLLYFDLRVRKEAFDLQLLAQSLAVPLEVPEAGEEEQVRSDE